MKRILLIASIVILASCAQPNQKITLANIPPAGKTLQAVVGKTPGFSLLTGGTVASWGVLGPIGIVAASASATSNGDELVRQNHIADPAVNIAKTLSKKLQSSYNLKVASNDPVMLQTENMETITQMYKDSDYLLLVNLIGWGTIYNIPGDLAVLGGIRMQLKEVSSDRVIAESICDNGKDYKYGLDELRDNGAAKIKEIFNELEHKCAKQFSETLGIEKSL